MKLTTLLNLIQDVASKNGIAKVWICGGSVRDKVLNKAAQLDDLDFTTGDNKSSNLAEEVYTELSKYYSLKREIMKDGHISLFISNIKLDFSSNYIAPEIDIYLNKLGISQPTSLQQEMYSRDFTCNSLLMTLDLQKVLDPTKQGIKDIKNKILKTCLSPEKTLNDNKNRIIRVIYLACKLGFSVDSSIITFIKSNPALIKQSSSEEYVKKQLKKATKYDLNKTIELLNQMNLWNYIPITEELYPYFEKNIK